MEEALKLKKISYIHAEAYPAGELKHGQLAPVDADMPVIAVTQMDLLEKLKCNLDAICDMKIEDGNRYYRLNRARTLRWLCLKVP